MKRKGQSAIEFVIIVSAVLFFFIVFLFSVQGNLSDKFYERRNLAVQEIALSVQDELNLASESSEGYHRSFTLPLTAMNKAYEISFVEDFVFVKTLDGAHALAFPIVNVTGQPVVGTNTVRKANGQVFLNS